MASLAPVMAVQQEPTLGTIEETIIDGLNIDIEYPTELELGEQGTLVISLTTSDFGDATFPDWDNNIWEGLIMIASDESLRIGDTRPYIGLWNEWESYEVYLEAEKQINPLFEILRKILGVVPGSSEFASAYDILTWTPFDQEVEYDVGGDPTADYFRDKNDADQWIYPWTFELQTVNLQRAEFTANGFKLEVPISFDEAGGHAICIYASTIFHQSGVSLDKLTIGKEYTIPIFVSNSLESSNSMLAPVMAVQQESTLGTIEETIIDGLNIDIEYPTELELGEQGTLVISLTTSDFGDATFPDWDNNIWEGLIMIASDESLRIGDTRPYIGLWNEWESYEVYLEAEKQINPLFEILRKILGVVPGSSEFASAYDILTWTPFDQEVEYDVGGDPTADYFRDKNDADQWIYPWTFELQTVNLQRAEFTANGFKLEVPISFDEAGGHAICIYVSTIFHQSGASLDKLTIGKEYTIPISPVSPRSGGPDDFGYTFIDSNTPDGPTYDWIEISGTGTEVLSNSDDSWIGNIDLGFFFNYYGTDYSQLAISNNGLLFSGAGTWQYVNQPITQTPGVHGFVAPFWDDIVTWGAGTIYYQTIGTAPHRMFVVEWYDNQHYHSSTSGVTFEAILYEGSNNIKFQYKDVDFGTVSGSTSQDRPPYDNGGSATVGIEGPTGDIGLQYSFNEQVIDPGLAILFKYPQFAGTNLYLTKQAPASKDHGSTMTYTLHYHNFGDTEAELVELEDTLPPEVEFVSASDGGNYDSILHTVRWWIGNVAPLGHDYRTVTVRIPQSVPIGTVIQNDASISTSNLEVRYDDNEAHAQTRVTGSNLPPNVGVEPNRGQYGGLISLWYGDPITFSYYSCPTATGVDIRIQINDGGPDITGSMTGGPPDWTYTTTFYPRWGRATVTYTVHGCDTDTVIFDIYIDPAGFIYDVDTGERIEGATVWLQRPDGTGDWENVPTGETPSVMHPDINPLITTDDGQYQWDVLAGSYRVHVEAPGYYAADSIVVSIPPPITDLHVGLTRIPVPNQPPVADAGGPYIGTVGEPINFDGTGSYDPDGTIISYEWDLDGDGVADDATGPTPSMTWSTPYSGIIRLAVTDDEGEIDIDETTLTVEEAVDTIPPTIESVTLDAYTTIPSATIHVTVEVTDNVGVTSVTADSVALTKTDGTWEGDITAPSTTGEYTLTIRAEDAAGNFAETTVGYSVVKPSGSIGIGVDPRLTTVNAGDTAFINIRLVSTENFDDIAYVYLTTEGVYPGYEANLTWFNWTSKYVKVPAGAVVNVPLEVSIPAGESGYKVFYAKLESTKWTPTAIDTGILYIV